MPEIIDVTLDNWKQLDQELQTGQELLGNIGAVVEANQKAVLEITSFYEGLLKLYNDRKILDSLAAHMAGLNKLKEDKKFPKEFLAQKVEALGPYVEQAIGLYKAVVEPYETRKFQMQQQILTQIEQSKQHKVGTVGDIWKEYSELKGWASSYRDP